MYLDDKIIGHPKLIRAGQLVGRNGVSRAFMLYVTGLVHARQYLTDGVLKDSLVTSYRFDKDPLRVALALCHNSVNLWHQEPGGYRIHDYLDYNKSAEQIKHQQQVTRDRVTRWRATNARQSPGGNGRA